MLLYLKTFPSRTGLPSNVVSEHHISVTRALSASDTGVATLVQSYLSEQTSTSIAEWDDVVDTITAQKMWVQRIRARLGR